MPAYRTRRVSVTGVCAYCVLEGLHTRWMRRHGSGTVGPLGFASLWGAGFGGGRKIVNLLSETLSIIVVSGATAWITVLLALRRFRKEHLWQKRVEAYEVIFSALHHCKRFSEVHLEASQNLRDVSPERDEPLRSRAVEAGRTLAEASDVSGFLLGEAAHSRLRNYIKDDESASRTNGWDEHLINDSAAAATCLRDLIPLARSNLKID